MPFFRSNRSMTLRHCLFFLAVLPAWLCAQPEPAEEPSDDAATGAELGYREAIILGLVEGITEYLPISSTGHLILTNQLLGLNDEEPLVAEGEIQMDADGLPYTLKGAADSYAIIIQAGAILAVVVLYWRRILRILTGLAGRDPRGLRLGLNLLVAFLPAAIIGLLANHWIESMLFAPKPIALALGLGAVLMWGVEKWRKWRPSVARDEDLFDLPDLSYRQCLTVGLLQCVAMWPGTSRSMMTIVGGYAVGLSPRRAAEFSFLLGLLTLSAAAFYKSFTTGSDMLAVLDAGPVIVGIAVAFLAAVLAVRWLVTYLTRHGLSLFAWYRLGLAFAVLYFME